MIAEINTNQEINWGAKGIARRLQNISNALNTYRYEVAYSRTFGRDPSNLDKPIDIYIQAITAETYEIVSGVDPLARVIEVTPEIQQEGGINLKVVIELE